MEKILGRAEALSDLVEYQSDSIVSKEILKKESGTITLFAFDAGQGLSEHTAPFDAFVLVAEGEGQVTISGKLHNVGAGQVIVMPANQPHSVQAAERFKMLLVMLKK